MTYFDPLNPDIFVPYNPPPPPGYNPADQTWADTSQQDGGDYGGDTYINYVNEVAQPIPRPELATSPEWLAFLNSLGLQREQFTADIQRQRGVAQSLAAQKAAELTAQGPLQRRQITGNAEARGMARSGQLVRSLAEQRAAEGRAQSGVQQSLAQTLSGLESSLAQKMIDLSGRRADQELSLRSQGYT